MKDFFAQNIYTVIFVLICIVAFILLLRFGSKKQIRSVLLYLVTRAEEEFGGGTGEIKYASVVSAVYERIPVIARFIITQKELSKMIESAVSKMKAYLSDKNETGITE
ncbi:MAG: hypothetical protein ACI4QR_05360 [Eubacteriales bacterium]